MVCYQWDPALRTGHELIDEQHMSLFALANSLERAIEEDADEESAVADAIWGLTDYVTEHFADEEDLMAAAGYPELPTHRSLHEQLTGETLKYTASYFNNSEDVDPKLLAPFFTLWLTTHIRRQDMRFVEYLRQRRG